MSSGALAPILTKFMFAMLCQLVSAFAATFYYIRCHIVKEKEAEAIKVIKEADHLLLKAAQGWQ